VEKSLRSAVIKERRMSDKFEVEKSTQLYVEGGKGAHIEIHPYPDSPETGIELHTPDEKSKEWFGAFDLVLSPEQARQLGKALVEFADEFDEINA
jgi:hypothetical protein